MDDFSGRTWGNGGPEVPDASEWLRRLPPIDSPDAGADRGVVRQVYEALLARGDVRDAVGTWGEEWAEVLLRSAAGALAAGDGALAEAFAEHLLETGGTDSATDERGIVAIGILANVYRSDNDLRTAGAAAGAMLAAFSAIGQPVPTEMLWQVAQGHLARGAWGRARAGLREGLERLEAEGSPDPGLVARFLQALGETDWLARRFEDSRRWFKTLLEHLDRHRGEIEDAWFFRTEAEARLGDLAREAGAFEEAATHYRESLRMAGARAVPGDHPAVARARRSLADVLEALGKEDEAERLRENRSSRVVFSTMGEARKVGGTFVVFRGSSDSLLGKVARLEEEIIEGLVQDGTPESAAVLEEMARVREESEFSRDEALELAEKALEIRRKYGKQDPAGLAGCLLLAGNLYEASGNLAVAEECFREACELTRAGGAAMADDFTAAVWRLGFLLDRRGLYREAAICYEEALRQMRAKKGEVPPEIVFRVAQEAGWARYHAGDLEDAREHLLRAIEVALEGEGEESASATEARVQLGRVLLEAGRLEEAEAMLAAAAEHLRRTSEITPTMVAHQAAQARLQLLRGDPHRARVLVRRAIEMERESEGWGTGFMGALRKLLGKVYAAEERHWLAELQFLRSITLLGRATPRSHPEWQAAVADLRELYLRTGRTEDARGLDEWVARTADEVA